MRAAFDTGLPSGFIASPNCIQWASRWS